MSRYGSWVQEAGLPVFSYRADQRMLPEAQWDPVVAPPTRRHFVALGNRRLTLVVDNYGGTCVWDEHDSQRWLVAPDPGGSGATLVTESGAPAWGTLHPSWPAGAAPERRFGPTWFAVWARQDGLELERVLLCPEGELPWLAIRIRLTNSSERSRVVRLSEEWQVRARHVTLLRTEPITPVAVELGGGAARARLGEDTLVILEALDGLPATPHGSTTPSCVLRLDWEVELSPGAGVERHLRFGIDGPRSDPAELWARSLAELTHRLPRASCATAPAAAQEVPWHAALLTGGACRDSVLGGHTLNQGSAYSYLLGFNGAARDPLQHALPLVYSEPDLALSVLRNTCAWSTPDGDLPYGLDGAKQPWTQLWQPSDANLWALWLAAEYAAATGDIAAFAEPAGYHPSTGSPAVPLAEHLRRQFRFLIDHVGRGEHGHLRIRNADWNDMALSTPGLDRTSMIERGESVLNSAMAAWVLPVWACLAERLGQSAEAGEARTLGAELRALVAAEWTGRWFRRGYGPGVVLGERDLWLEVQPWAILCGAASVDQAHTLLDTCDDTVRRGSPLGARVRWPVPAELSPGEGTSGGIWPAINMTLVWAAARVGHPLAVDEWNRMTLTAHTASYPDIWEGTLSGPDSWNAPESARPGRTWAWAEGSVAMQAFPVGNMHSHAQPRPATAGLPAPAGRGAHPHRDPAGGRWRQL